MVLFMRWESLALLCFAACAAKTQAIQTQTVDSTARVVASPRTLSPDRVEARFFIDSGRDQMTTAPRMSGLTLVVHIGDKEWRQTIATCVAASRGSALGGGTETILEVALCDAEFRLLSLPGSVVAERVKPDGGAIEVARIKLPKVTLRAVSPKEELLP